VTVNMSILPATSMDCLDVKPDVKLLGHITPTTSNQYSDVKPSDCADWLSVNVDPDQKPDSCVMCRYVSPYDMRLHQIPLVVMKEFDVSKLVYQLPADNPHENEMFAMKIEQPCEIQVHADDLSYICFECDKRLRSVTRFRLHMALHSGVKPYTCDLCFHHFWTRRQVLRHNKKCCER
jgi:hypothetical protein